jgi:hypothetical protein
VVTTEPQTDQQSPAAEDSKKKRSRTTNSRRPTAAEHDEQHQPSTRASNTAKAQPQAPEPPEESENEGQERQPARSQPDINKFIELQISEAIQPILADFRKQMTQAVQQEMEQALAEDGPGAQLQEQAREEPETTEVRAPMSQQEQHITGEQPVQQSDESHPPAKREDEDGEQGLIVHRLRPVFAAMLGGLEDHAEDWLHSMLMAGLAAGFSEAARAGIEKAAEERLGALLRRIFASMPDSSMKRELQPQAERTLHAILHEVLDAIFADDVRNEVQSSTERATRAMVHRDFGQARAEVQGALEVVVQKIISVQRRQWQRVLRLLFKIILAMLEDSLSSSEQEDLPNTSTKGREEQAAGKD